MVTLVTRVISHCKVSDVGIMIIHFHGAAYIAFVMNSKVDLILKPVTYTDALSSELRIPPDKLMQSSVNKNTIIYNINTQVVIILEGC